MHKFNDPAGRFTALQATRLPTTCLFTIALVLFLSIAGQLQALTISEVMYHSSTLDAGGDEFIELYNENVDPVDLSGYSICNGINFVFPAAPISMVIPTWLFALTRRRSVTATASPIRSATGSVPLTIPVNGSRSAIPAAGSWLRCATTIAASGPLVPMVRGIP